MGEDYTPGEMARALRALTRSTEQLAATVNELASRDRADLLRFEHLAQRIEVLESWQTWAMRIVLGVVITAAIGLVLAAAP